MLSILAVGVCAIAALVLRNRPDYIVLLYVTLWILIPHTVVIAYNSVGLHPATLLALSGLATTLLMSSQQIRDAWRASVEAAWGIYAALFAFLVLASLSQAFSDSVLRGIPIALDQIVAPLAIFAIARCAVASGMDLLRRSLWLMLFIAAIESILALVQRAIQQWIPYDAYYTQKFLDASGKWERYGGTFDHPLGLGLLLCLAMWCLWVVPWASVRLGFAALFLAGIASTQSRTGLIIAIAGLVAIMAFAPLRAVRKGQPSEGATFLRRIASFIAIATVALVSWRILIDLNITHRLMAGDGSIEVRQAAYRVFFDNANDLLLWGGGSSSNYTFAQQHGSPASFENPFMAYTADFGMLAALLYFGTQLAIAVRALIYRRVGDGSGFVAITAVVAIVGTQAFSSLAAPGASAMLLWWILALASCVRAPVPAKLSATLRASATSQVPSFNKWVGTRNGPATLAKESDTQVNRRRHSTSGLAGK
ncbi:O-antigen ligase family protein [Mycolicibacterium sp.]|uniref:O-antigen ligase family protein n=1 Tax=Mycolicibacterium sp. TaxID=2320850 RepID=UPI001A2FF771|nr:O-antigen ligase family protein [Mycolicibacterium sp.]MBJ7336719.1 hypothetical protein [Mycolicibacterium sp.]